jgi:hypothetical protein
VSIHFELDNAPQVGAVINFTATRGEFVSGTSTNTTDAAGNASVDLRANNAGPAVITATCPDPDPTTAGDACDDAPSTQIEVEFVATVPRSLILQANPTTLGSNTGGSTAQQSIITAVVRDTDDNLVKNQVVNFRLTDVSSGSIFPASATTDSFGKASTVYTAGAATSAQDRVIIDAEVAGTAGCIPDANIPTGPCDRVTLTVAQQTLFVILGTGNTVQVVSDTHYGKPYAALVTDANSNPIAGARVELNAFPIRYEKGFYTRFFNQSGACTGWGKVRTVSPLSIPPNPDNTDQACNNEDLNRNGILNPGEDINNNGRLDPGNVAAVPTSLTTNASGIAEFIVTYQKDRTWVEVEIEARATAAGSEGFNRARFFLPGLANDFTNCDVSPPGQLSPYGLATTCGCDELAADPGACPTIGDLSPVNITPGNATLPAAGGTTVPLSVTGGTETSYIVATTAGTLTNTATGESGSSIVVDFGDSFTLAVLPNTTGGGRTITITATDEITGRTGTATITQAAPVSITPASATLAAAGGTVNFSVTGGEQTSYDLTASAPGILSVSTVNFGQVFTLTVPANTTGATRTITVTATDTITGDSGTAIVTQTP